MQSSSTTQLLREEAAQRARQRQQQQERDYYDDDDDDDGCNYIVPLYNGGSNSPFGAVSPPVPRHDYRNHQQPQHLAVWNGHNCSTSPSPQQYPIMSPQQYQSTKINTTPMSTVTAPAMQPRAQTSAPVVVDTASVADNARKEWKLYGKNATQTLEEKRRQAIQPGRPGDISCRVILAQDRVDLVGAKYTAYVIKVTHFHPDTTFVIERRYSEFYKFQQRLKQQHGLEFPGFPGKQNLGVTSRRLFNTVLASPKKQSNSNKKNNEYDELVQYRLIQLDAWLVEVFTAYNKQTSSLTPAAGATIREFLLSPTTKPPCDAENDLKNGVEEEERLAKWKNWNNPFVTTLGSAIRQATQTVQHMCLQNQNNNNGAVTDQSIPLDLLQAAAGLCFLTVLKAGFVVSGRFGTGLVIQKLPTGAWSAPCAMGTVGMGWGAVIGSDVTHYLIILTTPKAVQDLVSSTAVQLGAEVGVAVGPIGRGAHGSVQAGDWTLHAAYAYAYSQGLFVGMSLEGSIVRVRDDVNAIFYGQACNATDLLQQPGPKAAEPLYVALQQALEIDIPIGAFRPSEILWPTPKKVVSPAESWKNTAASTSPPLPTTMYR